MGQPPADVEWPLLLGIGEPAGGTGAAVEAALSPAGGPLRWVPAASEVRAALATGPVDLLVLVAGSPAGTRQALLALSELPRCPPVLLVLESGQASGAAPASFALEELHALGAADVVTLPAPAGVLQGRVRLLGGLSAGRRRAEEQLAAVTRARDDFLAVLSHELRSPMTAVQGWAELLRRNPRDPARLQRGLEVIDRNARIQARLVADLLDVSRIASNKLSIERRPVGLHQAIGGAVEDLRPLASSRSVRLTASLPHSPLTCLGDLSRLTQVVWNLVGNALKFTPSGGMVEVRLRRDGDTAVLQVVDNGQGIEPALLTHIFEPYRQADTGSSRRHGGLGLGLAIVKRLVELHGGTVRADSAGPGLGATFTLTLPVEDAVADEPSAEIEAPVSRQRLSGIRVLVVDDDADCRELVARLLEAEGAETEGLGTAVAALASLENRVFHVVLSDLCMAERDGYWLVRQIRLRSRRPVVAVTAMATPETRQLALDAGFDVCLEKPFDPARLLRVVGRLAGRRTTVSEPIVRS